MAGDSSQRDTVHDTGRDTVPDTVLDTVLDTERTVADRMVSVHRALSGALAAADPAGEVLIRVGRMCRGPVVILGADGEVEGATAPAPTAAILAAIDASYDRLQEVTVGEWYALATAVAARGGRRRWLVAASRRRGTLDLTARLAVSAGGVLLESIADVGAATRRQDVMIRTALFEQAIGAQPMREDTELGARLMAMGVRFDDELRVAVAAPVGRADQPDRTTVAEIEAAAAVVLDEAGVVAFTLARADHVAVLVQCSPETVQRLLLADARLASTEVGIGRRVETVADVRHSYHDAQLGRRALRLLEPSAPAFCYEEFDVATRLLADVGVDRMVVWAHEFLHPLDGRDSLMDALRAFLAHHQNVKAAARSLALHHNSLRYRLSRIEDLLGVTIADPAAISSMYLAVTALDLAAGDDHISTVRATTRSTVIDADSDPVLTSPVPSSSRRFGAVHDPGH